MRRHVRTVGTREKGWVYSKDLFDFLSDYDATEIANALGVTRRRVTKMQEQQRIEEKTVDRIFSRLGLPHLYHEIEIHEGYAQGESYKATLKNQGGVEIDRGGVENREGVKN